MTKKYRNILLIAIICILFTLPTLTVHSEETSVNTKTTPTKSISRVTLIPQTTGVLSNNKKLIASTTKSPNSWTNEDIVIQDLEKNDRTTIKLKLPMPFQIRSWSPDNSYLYIFEESQYYGGLVGKIIDVKSKKTLYSFPTLNQDITWVNDTGFIYFNPQHKNGVPTNLVLFQHNIKTGKSTSILKQPVTNQKFPYIKSQTYVGGQFEFGFSTNYIDYTSDISEGVRIHLKTKKYETIDKSDLLVNSIKSSLPSMYSNIEISSVTEIPGREGTYMITARDTINSAEPMSLTFDNTIK